MHDEAIKLDPKNMGADYWYICFKLLIYYE